MFWSVGFFKMIRVLSGDSLFHFSPSILFFRLVPFFFFRFCMTQKIIFSNYFDMGIKNAEFDATFESDEKVIKKIPMKKVICMKV
jgi:hypothetical protein